MTLIIGVKASDGIVIGADGAATMGNVFQRTIQQPVQKLTDIDGKIIVGVAGPVGLSQQFTREIKILHSSGKFKDESKIFAYVQEATWKHVEREWKAAKVVGDSMGQQTAMGGAMSATVIGMAVVNEPLLFQLDHKCSPEEATSNLPFIAIGSGQPLADPFLAFLRRVFWPTGLPLLSEGILATLWSLQHAISLNTGGVSAPIQIMTLSKDPKTKAWNVSELTDGELEEHKQNIGDAEKALAGYRQSQQGEPSVKSDPPLPT